MRLTEITVSDFRNVKNIGQAAATEKHVPGDDIIGKYLEKKGFKFLKQGGFSDVYETSDKTAVVKYNRLEDLCYQAFINYVNEDPRNPSLPRMSKPFNFNFANGYNGFIIVMEKLVPFTEQLSPKEYKAMQIFLEYQHVNLHSNTKPETTNRAKEHLATLDAEQKTFIYKFAKRHVNAIREYFKLLKAWPQCEVDIHTGNFMFRPTTGDLVIVDPLAWLKEE